MIVRLQQIFKGSGIKIYSKYMYQVSDKLKINDFVTDGKTTLGRIIEKVENPNSTISYKKLRKISGARIEKLIKNFNLNATECMKLNRMFTQDIVFTKDKFLLTPKQVKWSQKSKNELSEMLYKDVSKLIQKNIDDYQDLMIEDYDYDDDFMGYFEDGIKWVPLR